MDQLFNPADYVRITNEDESSVEKGKKVIKGRYAGKDYVFPFGEPVDISLDAARHIFGFENDNKATALARLGWTKSSDDLEEGIERLKRIRFEDLQKFVEVPRAKRAATLPRTEHARPLVKVGGNPGAAASAVAPEDPPVDEDAQGDEPDIAQAI